jgi:hypothetical protein
MGTLTGRWPLLLAVRTHSRADGHLAMTIRSNLMHSGTGLVER